MSSSPHHGVQTAAAVPVVTKLQPTNPSAGGCSSSEHHDSGIDNCNSSETSNCCHPTDHEREEDATTATTLTATHRDDDVDDVSSSGSEDDIVTDGRQRNAMPDELADYEIIESTEEVKVNGGGARPKGPQQTTSTAACPVLAEAKRFDNNNKIATSKEEKQRQNEEIIILESSSVSSETGSWDSVSPDQLQQIQQQQQQQVAAAGSSGGVGGVGCGLSDSSLASRKFSEDYDAKPIRTACFIDASSLLDDSELAALTGAPQPPEQESQRTRGEDLVEPNTTTENKKMEYEIKDQFSSGEYTPRQLAGSLSSSSGSGGGVIAAESGRNSSSPPKTTFSASRDPKESEKLQGSLVFRNSINQYSGVLIEDPPEVDSGRTVVDTSIPESSADSGPTRSFPLRNARSSLLDIYQENKKNSGFKINYMRTQSENHAETQSIILPDTPHNSILNVNLIQDSESRGRQSSEEGEENPWGHRPSVLEEQRTPKRHLKFMESAPIVSGGVSVVDFSPKLCESPPVRRKLDTCPILSGFSQEDIGVVEEPAKPTVQRSTESTSFKSWVIDLKDLPQTEEDEQSSEKAAQKQTSQSAPAHKFSHFYVSLDNVQPVSDTASLASDSGEVLKKKKASVEKETATSMKKSTGFFVDFNANDGQSQENAAKETQSVVKPSVSDEKDTSAEDKKNMFSMFFDIGERKPVPKKESLSFTSKLSETINRRKELERRSESPRTSTERMDLGAEKCSSLTFVPLIRDDCGGADEVQLRPKFRSSLSEDKRHTWTEKNSSKPGGSADNRSSSSERPISFTVGDKGLMSIIDKIPLLSKTSSMSIDSSISPLDDFTCSKSELSTFSTSGTSNSNNSSTKELSQQLKAMGSAEKRRQKDVKINETFDKSSQSSITDGVLSKDLSPDSTATNTDDVTYQNEPVSCEEVLMAQVAAVQNEVATNNKVAKQPINAETGLSTIVEANEKLSSPAKLSGIKTTATTRTKEEERILNQEATHTMETLQATIEKQRKLLETVNETVETTSFVRLSDMDKPFTSFEIYSSGGNSSLTKSGGDRRTRSMAGGGGYEGNYYYEKGRHNSNMYYSTDTNIINLASSFENSRSLSRIFPHLSKVFSSSLPANVGLENMPSELTSMSSDLSANSSVTSSCVRSVQDSGDESSIFCRQPRRLGEDLLKMFLHEIGTDVAIDIGHRKLKAHKCILQSRCQYFAAILAGGYVHNAGNMISLPGYSYEAVHFALCHIYSGASHPPEGISLMELAAIADLLGLVGLREVTAYALKVNYCHNFHKPCLGCIEGILQVLPVALNHGLDDLYRKCLKWTCKHYLKIWPTRTFASLSSDLRHRCQQQIIAHLCSENVLTTILDCENLLAVVAPLRWGAAVENILHEISDTAQIYLSEHFASLVASDSFLSLGHDQSCHISALESLLLRTASTLSPDQACRSYQRVTKLHQVLHSKILTQQQNKIRTIVGLVEEEEEEDLDWDVEFIRLVGAILSSVEQCLQRQCSRAMRTSAWHRLDVELRKKIQKLACLTDPLFERRQRANARQQQHQKAPVYQASYNRNQDIQQVRLAIHAHSKRSSQGYIIDQFTNNNNSNRERSGAGGRTGFKSHSTTHTQTHLNNNNGITYTNHGQEKRDKSVQASHKLERNQSVGAGQQRSSILNGAAKLEKSKSHSHVSGSSSGMVNNRGKGTQATQQPRQPNVSAIQRNASTSQVNRMRTDVKPRYLENISSKSHRAIQPTNEAVRHVKQLSDQYSSTSGTSTRTPSPSVKRKQLTVAPKNVDSHMSLDSLASPKKQPLNPHRNVVVSVHQDDNTALSRDSLADSIRSSIRTEGTISQESLAHHNQPQKNRLSVETKLTSKNMKNNRRSTNDGSTSGSTSSVGATQKGGRGLMRNFSDSGVVFRNPGNASKGLSSNSSNASSARTSFLSKKSKEILERRSLMETAQRQAKEIVAQREVPGTTTTKQEMRRSLPINKSSSASNIPTHRRIFNTTLHLRKTAHMAIPEKTQENANAGKKREGQVGLKPSRIAQKVPQLRSNNGYEANGQGRKGEKSERDLLATEKAFEVLGLDSHCEDSMDGFESKMVRSSTFSKDFPDLNQSIEIS